MTLVRRALFFVSLVILTLAGITSCESDDITVIEVVDIIDDNPGEEEEKPGEQPVIPDDPENGYRVYILNRSGWDPIYLYLYGDVNDLAGTWPGVSVAGHLTLGDYQYDWFDLPENVNGKYEYIEFNNVDSKHTRENRPHVLFGSKRSLWYLVDNEKSTEISDPLNPGTAPEPPEEGGGEEGGGGDDDDGKDDPDDVDWEAAMAYVFDGNVIPEIHISITRAEWDKLIAYYDANHDTQEYVKCDISYSKRNEKTVIDGAGLRLKGNTSRRRPEENGRKQHVHFGLDFHHYTKDADHTLKGLRKMDLKWFKDDPLYVREVFCYDLFRRQGVWTGIRDVYARLWVKVGDESEVYYGVYGMMEHIDKNYVRSRKANFGKKGGNLWKCRYGADLKNTNADFGVDDNVHDHTYVLKTNKDTGFDTAKAQLQDFIRKLNTKSGSEFDTWIASVTDVDLLLKTTAVNVAVGMWDDYWNSANNYFLYFDTKDASSYKVWFIPYDYDNTLGTSLYYDSGRQDPLKWGSNPLITKILQNSAWRDKYLGYLRALCAADGDFYYSTAISRISAWHQSIYPYVSNDTGEDMTIEDRPASWGNHGEYRVLDTGSNNFFKVKASSVK